MPKKTLPLITAAAARDYVAPVDPTGLFGKIDYAVKAAAALGRSEIDLAPLVPQPHSGAWMEGKTEGNTFLANVISVLQEAGYTFDVRPAVLHKHSPGTARADPRTAGRILMSWATPTEVADA